MADLDPLRCLSAFFMAVLVIGFWGWLLANVVLLIAVVM